ncbi:hypothetical protein PsorP6_013802 [Peronosclerospora sorghi]|uniref:Uncharacterized protein n=1 Tax=Peronosclerospora sorghi TaxID=230839 RepID=A0ACC0VFM3_9STRA|nr:hypothetical protein PsorP6_013802 [Peronosclerospora sorghi]
MVVSGDDDEGVRARNGEVVVGVSFFHSILRCNTYSPYVRKQNEVYGDSKTLKTLPNEVIDVLQASLNGQVTTESSFSKPFGFVNI